MRTIALRLTAAGVPTRVRVRGLRGRDEMAIEGIDTRAALALVAGLLMDDGGSAPAVEAITASDRDRMLAAIHDEAYGDTIAASPACAGCGAPFDLSFSLADLLRHLDSERERVEVGADGVVRAADGSTVRLPAAIDELAAGERSEADGIALLRDASGGAPSERLEAMAPLLDVEVTARCPECGVEQIAGFDIQSYLLSRLLNDRGALVQEIHLLASSYGWSLTDILSLPRDDRRALVAAIDDERTRAMRSAAKVWR